MDNQQIPSENEDLKFPKQLKVTWDEKNLAENEEIKQSLNPMKIDEPKTPYHNSPISSDNEEEDS